MRALIQRMANYRDKFGCITQADGDGGDSAHRMGAYYTYLVFLSMTKDPAPGGWISIIPSAYDIDMLEIERGKWVRNPNPSEWWSRTDTFSRDQAQQILSFLIVGKGATKTHHLYVARKANKFLHFNTYETGDGKYKFPDLPGPIEISMFARGLLKNLWLTYIFDFQLLFDVVVTRYFALKGGSKDFDANYLGIIIANTEVQPTFWGKWARAIYKKKADVPARLRDYHAEGPGRNGIEPLGEIAVEAFKRL